MMLFLAVMLTDVVLLDLYNTFGLPTSTTVSPVFELLGAAVAVTLFTMWTTETSDQLGDFINSGKALAIIGGIFISIAIAFVVGSVIMYGTTVDIYLQICKTLQISGCHLGWLCTDSDYLLRHIQD